MAERIELEASVAVPRRLKIRMQEVQLDGDFEGWSFVCRTNVHWNVLEGMQSGKYDLIREALAKVLISWNFVNEEGERMPQPSPDSIGYLPLDLMTAVLKGATDAILALTKS